MPHSVHEPSSQGGHRVTSADPLGGGYAYVGDSPANFVDPSGMRKIAPTGGGGGGTGGSPSGTYTSAYCDTWAVLAGICIPSNSAPDATVTTTGGGGSGGGGGGWNSPGCWASVALLVAGLVFSVIGIAADLEPLADAVYESHTVLQLDTVGIIMHGSLFDQLSLVADIFGVFVMNVIGPMLGLWGTMEAGVRVATLATPAGVIATGILFAATLALGISSVIGSCSGD